MGHPGEPSRAASVAHPGLCGAPGVEVDAGDLADEEEEEDEVSKTTHVCRGDGPMDRYPRGRRVFRIGDDQRMAPAWMARNSRI